MFLYSSFFQFSRGTCWCAKKVQNCKVLKHYVLCTFSVSRSFHEKNQKTYDISQGKFMSYNLLCILAISSIFLLVVKSWNRQLHGQTIHPTEKFNSINLYKIICVVTWAQLFLTSMVMDAVRGAKNVIGSTHF